MKRFMSLILAALVIIYMVPLLLVFFFQRSFMYFPPDIYLSPADVNLNAVEIENTHGKRAQTTSWRLDPKGDNPVVMFFHGNGSAVYSNHDIYRDLNAQGYGVLGVGYVGYPSLGGALGKPSQRAIVEAAAEQYDTLVDNGISPDRIIFYGTSLGSGIAAQLAALRKPAMLIAEAPFNSTLDIGRQSMPIFPVRFLMRDKYRSDMALSGLDIPLVWLHGTKDTIIPVSQGQKLYDSYNGPKTHIIIEGGQHTNLWALGGKEFVIAAIEAR